MLYLPRWQTIGLWLAIELCIVAVRPLAHWLSMTHRPSALDAAGELQILFEVARQDLIAERLDTTVDAIRTRLRAGKIGYVDLGGSDRTVQVRIRDACRRCQGEGGACRPASADRPASGRAGVDDRVGDHGSRRLASAGFPGCRSGAVDQRIVHGGA